MTFRLSSSQQRIEGIGNVPQGPWTSATYGRANGIVTVTSIAHRLNKDEKLYVKPGADSLLRTFDEGQYTIAIIDEDTFSISGTGQNFIEAATAISYRSVRSLVINASDKMELSVGSGTNEDDAVFITKSDTGNIRVGINNTNPEYDLDVEGQIRTTRSIISDTAQIRNLDVTNEFVTKGLDLRGPNLINFEETDPTQSDFGTIYYPTADNPPRQTQNNRVATTKFVYDVATADNGGRVYVSSVAGIGDDDNDGRSAAKPVRTIKKASQIAYSLQQDTQTPEYVSIIVSGGEYLEDNPISLPYNCSLIGDNLRRVILRPLNMDRHMIKASNETYCAGVVFRDHLDANGSPDWTWKYAYVFDDKQRLNYEPDLEPFQFSPGLENKGRNIFAITFENHTGDNTTLLVGYAVEGGSSSSRAIIETITFTGPQASPYSSGTIVVLMDDDESTFQLAERLYYADVYANIIKTGASPSDSLDVADRESQRPETEIIKHQRYQWVVNSETEKLRFDGSSDTIVDATNNTITIPFHRLETGWKVFYTVENTGGTVPQGLVKDTTYYIRSIDDNTIALYDTALNALNSQVTTGVRDLGDPGTGDEHTLFHSRVFTRDNTVFFPKHGLFTGDGVYYRPSKASNIGGLVTNSLIYVYKVDNNYFSLCNTQADATSTDIGGNDTPVVLPLTDEGKGYQRFEKALNVVDVATLTTDLATQQTYNGIKLTVTGASRTIEGIPFVGHDYEVGQEVQVYGLPYTAIDFGSSASTSYTQSTTTLTVTVANTDPTKMNSLWPNLTTIGGAGGKGVGVHITFDAGGHQSKSFHIAQYATGTLAQTQSDFASVLGGSSNLGAGVARYNSSTNEAYFVIRASDSATRSGNANVLDNLGDFNGRKYVTHRIERADGYSLNFCTRGSCSKFATEFDPSGDQQVCSATNYALMSLRNSPYAFEKVEFGSSIQEMAKSRDAAETLNNNVDFIALESYAHVKKLYNAGTSTNFTRSGTYTCSGKVMTVVCGRGHGVFAKNSYSLVYSGATADGAYIIDDTADHRTFTILLSAASTDSGTVTVTVPAPWQTPNSVPPIDRPADGSSLILANKQFIAQEAVARMLANNPGYNVPTGSQACIDDAVDYIEAFTYNLAYGGNDQVWDGSKYYVDGSHVVGEENESVETFNLVRDLAIQVTRNEPITITGGHGLTQIRDYTITPDAAGSGQGNKHADARNLIWSNKEFIADIAVGRMNADFGYEVHSNKHVDAHDLIIANKDFIAAEAYAIELAEDPTLHVPTGNGQDCIDDIADIVNAIAFNVQHGGNNKVWDAASYYVGTPHLDDEEFQSTRCIEHAKELVKKVLANNTIVVRGTHLKTQTFDTTITHDSSPSAGVYTSADCTDVRATVDTLFEIIHSAILNDSLGNIKKVTPRPYKVPSPNKLTASGADYNPSTGIMTLRVNTDTKDVTNATFTPANGNLELEIGAHTLTTNDKIRIKTGALTFTCNLDGHGSNHAYPRTTIDYSTATTGTTYNPTTGIVSITTTSGHGLQNGDWIKFEDDSLVFSCDAGTGNHSYPRPTDPISMKWVQVSNVGGLTFDIGPVTASQPSVFAGAHTFVSATANGIWKKRDRAYEQDLDIASVSSTTITVNVGISSDTSAHLFVSAVAGAVLTSHGISTAQYIKLANDSLTFTCDQNGYQTNMTYPKSSSTANQEGWSDITAVTVDTVDIQIGKTTVEGFDTKDATYTASTGVMVVTIGANDFKVGQTINLAPGSIDFTCDQDDNQTVHSYPRPSDPYYNEPVEITAIGNSTHTATNAVYDPAEGKLTLTIADHGMRQDSMVKIADGSVTFTCAHDSHATNHAYPRAERKAITATDGAYNTATGLVTITAAGHGLTVGEYIKVKDNALSFSCTHGGGGTSSYPRPTDPISGKWIQVETVAGDNFTFKCLTTIPSTNTTTHTFVSAVAGGIIQRDPDSNVWRHVQVVDKDTINVCISVSSNETTHRFVSATANGITQKDSVISLQVGQTSAVNYTPTNANYDPLTGEMVLTLNQHPDINGATPHSSTDASYDANTGKMEITLAGHGFENGNFIRIPRDSFNFTCDMDGGTSTKSYPRANDTAADWWLEVEDSTENTFKVDVGKSPRKNFTVSAADYNPTTGVLELEIGKHSLVAGTAIRLPNESLIFTCDFNSNNNVTQKKYPRASGASTGNGKDYAFETALNIDSVGHKKLSSTLAAYNPTTGVMTLTIAGHGMKNGDRVRIADDSLTFTCNEDSHGSNHSYPRASQATFTAAAGTTYNPTTGQLIVTTSANHGMAANDWIKFNDNAISFTCLEDSNNTTHAYPRSSDPMSGKWVQVESVTSNTFTVSGDQILDWAPSTNATTHTFVSGVTNGIVQKDPASGNFLTISNVSTDTFDVQVLTSSPSTNTTTHTYISSTANNVEWENSTILVNVNGGQGAITDTTVHNFVASPKIQPTGASYNPTTGVMAITVVAHGMSNGEYVLLDDNTFTFTCDKDSHGTNHTYPRVNDPASGSWLKVSNVTNDTFEVTVLSKLPSTNTTTHTFVSATAGITRSQVWTGGDYSHTYVSPTDLTPTGAAYNPTTGIMTLTVPNHGMSDDEYVKIADGAVTFNCAEDGGGTNHAYPRSTDPASGKWLKIDKIDANSFSVQVLAKTPSTNVTAHTYVTAAANSVERSQFIRSRESIQLADSAVTFNCAKDANASNHSYPRAALLQHTATDATYDPNDGVMTLTVAGHGMGNRDWVKLDNDSIAFSCPYGVGMPHTWAGGTSPNAITITAGSVKKDVTDAVYAPSTGLVELTIGAHTFTTSDTLTVTPDALSFTCNADRHATVHSYPRSTDPSYNTAIAIVSVTATTVSCNVGAVSGTVSKTYPRAADPIGGEYTQIFNVTANTFSVQVLEELPSTHTSPHTFVSAASNGITHKRDPYRSSSIPVSYVGESMRTVTGASYNETSGVMNVTVLTHGLSSGDRIKFAEGSLTFTCNKDNNATNHSYPRKSDPYYDKWLQITSIDVDTFSVQVGTGGPNDRFPHSFVSATPGGIKFQDGTIRINVGKSTNASAHAFVSAASNSVKTGGVYNHTFVPSSGITAQAGTAYNPTTGWMTVTSADHGLVNGDYITVDEGGISFTCTHDSNVTTHAYPRKTDPVYAQYVIVRNCTQNTFEFNALQGTTPTNATAHTFVSALTGAIKRASIKGGGNYPHRFISASANGVEVSGDNQDCKDDVLDVLQVVSWNLAMGGNDFTYDAANLYVTGNHLAGEEHHAIYALRQAKLIATEVFTNETVTTGGHTTRSQVKDLTITQDTGLPICNAVVASLTTLMNIIEVAIDTDSLSGVTRTASHATRCADVASTITTLTSILTTAIGTTGSPGNLTGVVRTYPISDEQCLDDIRHVIRSWMYDLRYGGNSKTIESAGKYINGTNIVNVNNEVTQTRQVYQKAKDMCVLAIRNQLPEAEFTSITPFSNASTTIDQTKPECNAMITNLTSLHTILDNALNTPTSLAGVTNTPPSTLLKDDTGIKKVPMLGDMLDLPVIEASPYIQNSSLISFLGASGAEIDGAKVAQPNVPRPGVYADANGVERPTWPHQGKSMVANAFTIISIGGGVGYNILNDGYTQLVSVFVIFGGDGVIVQSGGYASLTNSASNFGTRSLKATGFRKDAYEFDIGTITNIINQTDNNGAATGRQIIEVGGTTLTNFPVEDYIIKIDGYTNTDPSKEYFILGVEKLSGSIGTQVTANVTTNDGLGLDLIKTDGGGQIAYSQGNLTPELVGKTIRFHRPSVCNSSSHTWEYVGAGDTYLALPQNGGVGIPANEAVEEKYGQVYTSGTNEFGDFKVGDFVTIFNRTGSISFVGTVSISELSSIKIVGGNITITGFSDSDELGGAFASDSLLPTQASVKDYINNKLGPYLNQPFSTNAVPSALVQLTTSGKINIEQIPALRPFNITSVASTAERLAIEDASAGDIAIETTSTTFEFAPSAVDTVNEYINIPAHGLATGDALTYFQGTANIGNLADGATYYVILHSVGANTTDYIKLATSLSDAQGGTARNLSSQGSGTHKLRTEGAAVSYILENDLDSMYIAFTPDATITYTATNLAIGSATGAQGVITDYKEGVVRDILVDEAGAGYASAPGITITAPGGGGVTATATCTITNGQISTITITNPGSKYFTQPTVTFSAPPTGGTQATAQGNVARIEARLTADLANNIKFSDVDFMLEESNTTLATGAYVHDTYDITVTESNHGFAQGDIVYLDFTSGSSPSGFYAITPVNANEYTVTAAVALLTSGNYNRKKIVDVTRTVNTSANDAANWTQLSSTNIDASNIVAGTIDPERLADTGVANSFTFLRGDSSYQYTIQSVKFATDDCMIAESSLSDTSYIEKVTVTTGGTGYTVGTYQNIPMLGGNVSISDAGVARATYTVADVTTGGIIATVSNLNQTPTSYTVSSTFDVEPSTTTGAGLGASIRFVSDGNGTLTVDVVLDGGSGYLGGDTLTFDGPLFGGTVQQPVELTVSTLTSTQAFGVLTNVSVVTAGTGYNADFTLTVPNELGTPSQAASLTAVKGTLPRYFGNASIDLKKANKLTPTTLQAGGSVFGNYGIAKFRKNVAEQALGDQTEGGFVLTVNGEVSIDQGAGSKLNADKLDGNEGAFYQNASNLVEGVIDPQRLANTTYNISISGTADFANVLFAETTAPSSANANLVSAANVGAQLALRSNSVNGIPTDAGGTRNGTLTFRRTATGNSVAQLAFSATDNLYIRGNSDTGTVYGNWAKIWHSENDGPPDINEPRRGTLPGPNADFLDNQQGLWYQQGYNIHDQRTVGVLGDPALPTLLGRNKYIADNLYVVSSGEKYTLYIPNYKAATGTNPVGNLSAGGNYTIYADDAAVNNIGTITVDPGGINEVDDTTTGGTYTTVTGSIAFVGAYTNKDIRVFGPNPGSKWTVTSSNLLTTGASQVFALSNTANGALLEMGRAGIVATPMLDVRSGGLSNDYDVRFEFSGGDATNGNGLLDIKTSSVTINSNTVWHSGNDGASSQLDAHYVDGWTQNSSNVNNTLVRRGSSGDISISDLNADQGIFQNTGTTILQLGDANGIHIGKATTNVLSIKGKNNGNYGYIRFGNDSNNFGWNGTHLSYNNVYFRNGRLGIGDSDPAVSLESSGDAIFGSTGRSANTYIRALAGDSYQCGFEAYGSNQGTGYLYVGQSSTYGGGIAYNGDNSPGAFGSEQGDDITFFRRQNGSDTRVAKYRYNDSTFHFFGQVQSRVAQGTAPFIVASNTVVSNLNADLLDGYTATGLPYLGNQVNQWQNSNEGQRRFYFSNNSHTYFSTGSNYYWRNDADYSVASLTDGGHWTLFEPGSDTTQTSYRMQIKGDNGLDIDSDSVGLSGGQRSVVLRADGSKQWVDRYGIIKRNNQSISESITINNGDSCASYGPLTVSSGYTISIASGGAWVIL